MSNPSLHALRTASALALAAALLGVGCKRPPTNPPAPPTPTTESPSSAPAPSPPVAALTEKEKIDHLLAALETSDATFIRNGSDYLGPEAAAHLRRKWKGDAANTATARDFIDRLASASSSSGTPYLVRERDGRTRPSREWFDERLMKIESSPSDSPTPPSPPNSPQAAALAAATPDDIIAFLRASDRTFLVEENDQIEKHSGTSLARRIRMKYALAGRPDLTASAFIERYCTISSVHGTEYRVREPDGKTTPLADWLRAEWSIRP